MSVLWTEDVRGGAGRALLVGGCLGDLALHRGGVLLCAKDVPNVVRGASSTAAGSIGRSHMAVVRRASRIHRSRVAVLVREVVAPWRVHRWVPVHPRTRSRLVVLEGIFRMPILPAGSERRWRGGIKLHFRWMEIGEEELTGIKCKGLGSLHLTTFLF